MKLPALTISMVVREPGDAWEFVAHVRGRRVQHGAGFETPAEAFAAAVAQLRVDLAREREARERPN